MNYIIAGAYAFEAMPVETVFSFLKRVNLNIQSVPTGKKSKYIICLLTSQI